MCPLRPYRWSILICASIMIGGLACSCGWFTTGEVQEAEKVVDMVVKDETGVELGLNPVDVPKAQ